MLISLMMRLLFKMEMKGTLVNHKILRQKHILYKIALIIMSDKLFLIYQTKHILIKAKGKKTINKLAFKFLKTKRTEERSALRLKKCFP